ncbi:MAG: hypothetical protein ACTHU0_36830 [Kofleriaceae bacterium]
MKPLLLALTLALVPSTAIAQPLELVKVDTGKQPLKLSAPAGWEVQLRAPERKDMSVIASTSPTCSGGPDISIMIHLDQTMTKPAQLLADGYKGMKPTKVHGWECIAVASRTEVMCAGKVKGLTGVVGVYFSTTDAAAYKRFGDPAELTSKVAASLSWRGKLSQLTAWEQPATDQANDACK